MIPQVDNDVFGGWYAFDWCGTWRLAASGFDGPDLIGVSIVIGSFPGVSIESLLLSAFLFDMSEVLAEVALLWWFFWAILSISIDPHPSGINLYCMGDVDVHCVPSICCSTWCMVWLCLVSPECWDGV